MFVNFLNILDVLGVTCYCMLKELYVIKVAPLKMAIKMPKHVGEKLK
jgi:hypothetical protein